MTWSKDGIPLDDKTVGIRTGDLDTILFIRSAERTHSGKYTLSVQIENMSDSADIHIQIVGWSCAAPRRTPEKCALLLHFHSFRLEVNNLFGTG